MIGAPLRGLPLVSCGLFFSFVLGGCHQHAIGGESACEGRERDALPSDAQLDEGLLRSYTAPLFWIEDSEGERELIAHVDPDDVEWTTLELSVEALDDTTLELDGCPTKAWREVEVRVESEDGKIDRRSDAWLSFDPNLPSEATLSQTFGAWQALRLKSGLHLRGALSLTAGLQGGVIVDRGGAGRLHTPCGGDEQLLLDQRATLDPDFARAPSPAALIEHLDGQQFHLDWGTATPVPVVVRLYADSQTACWNYGETEGAGGRWPIRVELQAIDGTVLVRGSGTAALRACEGSTAAECWSLGLGASGRFDEGEGFDVIDIPALTGGAVADPKRVHAGSLGLVTQEIPGGSMSVQLDVEMYGPTEGVDEYATMAELRLPLID